MAVHGCGKALVAAVVAVTVDVVDNRRPSAPGAGIHHRHRPTGRSEQLCLSVFVRPRAISASSYLGLDHRPTEKVIWPQGSPRRLNCALCVVAPTSR
jgi:hypothetical protein